MFRKASIDDIPYINKVLVEFKQPKISNIISEYIIYDNNIGIINYNIVGTEVEIYYLYVEKEYRNNNIGGQLLTAMIDECKKKSVTCVHLEVRKSNNVAISLYKKYGFIATGVSKNHYKEPTEDAVRMSMTF